jgi:2-phosphosulfolactate phosphatase
VAGASGCRGICLVVKPPDGKYDLRSPILAGQPWIFGGEENGKPIQGGELNNSPLGINPETIVDKYIKFYSTNGAKALEAITQFNVGSVFLASFANVQVTVKHLQRQGFSRFWLVGAGFYESPALEDTVCGGRVIDELISHELAHSDNLEDGARLMWQAAEHYRDDDERLIQDLYVSQVSRLLTQIGRRDDVAACVRGDGIAESLRDRMERTVIQLQWIEETAILVPTTL